MRDESSIGITGKEAKTLVVVVGAKMAARFVLDVFVEAEIPL
jgi:hypothetical protein